MPSLSERQRNNVRAGVFVTVSLLLGLAAMVWISGVMEQLGRTSTKYTVQFPVSSGVTNLKSGSEVRVGGVPMGKVLDIKPIYETIPFSTINVDFKVDSRVKLFTNANIIVGKALLGGDGWLDISSVGSHAVDPLTGKPGEPVAPGQIIQGTAGGDMLTSLLGVENRAKADEIIENVRVATVDARTFVTDFNSDYHSKVQPFLSDAKDVGDNAKVITADLRNRWPTWAQKVEQIMDAALEGLAKGDEMLGHGRDLLAENRDNVKAVTTDAREVAAHFKDVTVPKVDAFLDKGQHAIDDAIALLQSVQVDYGGWVTDLNSTLANANLTSQQLKLAMIEIRRSPWKLLYRPTSEELSHELLYEATRSFAVAATDLRASTEAVKRVMEQHRDLLTNPENKAAFERLTTRMIEGMERYEKAQQDLLGVLKAENNPG